MIQELIFAAIIGYVLGSIPFALVIGKVFYKKDIRNFGSKNLGGGNAGRVLGKKAGVAVMILDILKVAVAIYITTFLEHADTVMIFAGLAAAMGHCFPMFARFKGGKAVATMYGFLFGMALFGPYDLRIFILPLVVFLIVLYVSKIISLSSICSAVFITIYIGFTDNSITMLGALIVFTIVIIWRHRTNMVKMVRGEENKITWM